MGILEEGWKEHFHPIPDREFVMHFHDGVTLPQGVFKTIIVDTEIGSLSNHRGKKLTITHMVVYGPMTGTKFSKIHSYGHYDGRVQALARLHLEKISLCVGSHPLQFDIEKDHQKLRGKPIIVEIGNQPPVPAKPYPHTEPIGYTKWDPFGVKVEIASHLEYIAQKLREA